MRIAAAMVLSFIAPSASAQGPDPAPLARVLTDYETAWQRKDAAALAALFTEDGFVLSGGHPPIRGRSAIGEYYKGHGGPLSLRALAYAIEGSLGYIIGGYAAAKGEPDAGKFTLTLRKQAGRWMIMSDMDNGNARRPAASSGPVVGEVVFVCEHGTVKSVIAAQWFNRLAAERNSSLRAVSRGIAPDEAIPPAVARNLAEDGFDVSGFAPKRLEGTDVAGAAHVVAIGVDSPFLSGARLSRWDDIPPASTSYAASRDAMRARIGALLDALSTRPR